jgi:hypothetical protein
LRIEQLLQNEIDDSQRWIEVEKDESAYRRDLLKRVELINWVLENMKNSKLTYVQLLGQDVEN